MKCAFPKILPPQVAAFFAWTAVSIRRIASGYCFLKLFCIHDFHIFNAEKSFPYLLILRP
jgi:hypothetical protein